MTPATWLIINADDLGFSPSVTDGILHAHTCGILTSTTLMTTMPDRDRAIELAKATPSLGVGMHLCLTQGTPLTGCPHLRDKGGAGGGDFPRKIPTLAWRLAAGGRVARQEALDEWAAQIEYALQRGLRPTHLDSHKHVHHLPWLQEVVCELAQRYGIKAVRTAREMTVAGTGAGGGVGYRVLAHLGRKLARRVEQQGLQTTDWFFGLAATGRIDVGVWLALIEQLKNGGKTGLEADGTPALRGGRIAGVPPAVDFTVGEVMVHPGFSLGLTRTGSQRTRLIAERETEMAALCAGEVRAALKKAGIGLMHYGQWPT
ncbi:MAG: ChbG/HpnK family deacetylase [Phycisphaerae bacterium]